MSKLWLLWDDRVSCGEKIGESEQRRSQGPSDGKWKRLDFQRLFLQFHFALHQKWQKLQVIWISIRYNQPRCTQDFTSPRASTNSSSHTTRGLEWSETSPWQQNPDGMMSVIWGGLGTKTTHAEATWSFSHLFSALGCFWHVQVLATLEKELQRCAKEFGAHILVGGRCLKVPKKTTTTLSKCFRTVFESQYSTIWKIGNWIWRWFLGGFSFFA